MCFAGPNKTYFIFTAGIRTGWAELIGFLYVFRTTGNRRAARGPRNRQQQRTAKTCVSCFRRKTPANRIGKTTPSFLFYVNIFFATPPRRRGRLAVSRVPLNRISFKRPSIAIDPPRVYEFPGSVLPLPRKMTIKKLFKTRAQRNVL